jgi:hypothetical protein
MLPGLRVGIILSCINYQAVFLLPLFSLLHCYTVTTMETTERLLEFRSTLRQILKELLKSYARQRAAKVPTSASRILSKASPDLSCLLQISQVSPFLNFESDHFGIDRYSISSVATIVPSASRLHSACNQSGFSLLPATRLSQLDLYELYANHATLRKRRISTRLRRST